MRIAEVTAQVLEADLSQPFAWSFASTAKRSACLVEIVGEDDTTGWGECFEPAEWRWNFRDVVCDRAVDIVQPDGCASCGLSEAKKIADMATVFGVRCVPHVWGTGVGLTAALQRIVALADNPPRHAPLAPMREFDRSEHPFRQAILTAPIEADTGMVAVREAVGLGIAIDRGALERFRQTPDR